MRVLRAPRAQVRTVWTDSCTAALLIAHNDGITSAVPTHRSSIYRHPGVPPPLFSVTLASYIYSADSHQDRGIVTSPSSAPAAQHLLQRLGLARTREFEQAGISRRQLRRLVDQGLVERISWGLYRLPGAGQTERVHLAEAARRVPGGVICLLSALRFHGLTTQNPFEIWLAIDRKAWRPRVDHPPLRFVYLSGRALREATEEHQVAGVPVRVFSAARTVVDCFRFRNKIGIDVAVEALRDYHRQHPKDLALVYRLAQAGRMARVLQPYLESLG